MNWDEFICTVADFLNADPSLLEAETVRIEEELSPYGEERRKALEGLIDLIAQCNPGLAWEFFRHSPRIMGLPDPEAPVKLAALGCAIGQRAPFIAPHVIRESARLLSQVDFETVRAIAALSEIIARYSTTYARRVWDESARLIGVLGGYGIGPELMRRLFRLCLQSARQDWECAFRLLEKFPQLMGSVREQGEVIDRGERVAFDAHLLEAYVDGAYRVFVRKDISDEDRELIYRTIEVVWEKSPRRAVGLIRELSGYVEELKRWGQVHRLGVIFKCAHSLGKMSGEIAELFVNTAVQGANRFDDAQIAYLHGLISELTLRGERLAQSFLRQIPRWWGTLERAEIEIIRRSSVEVWESNPEVAVRLLEVSTPLLEMGKMEVWRKVWDFVSSASVQDRSAAMRFLDRAVVTIEEVINEGGRELLSVALDEASGIAQSNVRVAVSLVEHSAGIYKVASFEGVRRVAEMVREIEVNRWSVAVGLVSASSAILQRLGFRGLERLKNIALRLASQESYGAASLWGKMPDLIDHLSDRELTCRVLEVAHELSLINGRIALSLLEMAPQVKSMVDSGGMEAVLNTAPRIASAGNAGKRLIDVSPLILERMGAEGWSLLGELILVLHHFSPDLALQVVENCPAILDRLEAMGEGTASLEVYRLALVAGKVNPRVATYLIDKSPQLINSLGLQGFAIVGHHLVKLAASDVDEAVRLLSAPPDTFPMFATQVPKGVGIKEVKPILATYLKALLGRRVEVLEGAHPRTDGAHIFLPASIRDYVDWEDNFRIYKVLATFEEVKLERGGWTFSCHAVADLMEEIVHKYGKKLLEEGSGDERQRFYELFPEPALMEDLLEAMERYRLEQIIWREYPGLKMDIEMVNRHQLKKRLPLDRILNPKRRLVEAIDRGLMAGVRREELMEPLASICRRAWERAEVLKDPEADIHTSARVAVGVYQEIEEVIKNPYRRRRQARLAAQERQRSINLRNLSRASREVERHLKGVPMGDDRGGLRIERESMERGGSTPADRAPSHAHGRSSLYQEPRSGQSQQGKEGGARGEAGKGSIPGESSPHVSGVYATEKIERLLKMAHEMHGLTPEEVERRVSMMLPYEAFLFVRSLEHSLERELELMDEAGTFLYPEWGEDIHAYRPNWARVREHSLTPGNLDFYRETMEKHRSLIKRIRREFQLLRPDSLKKRKRERDGEEIDLDAYVEYLVDRRLAMSPQENNYIMSRRTRRDIAVAFLVDMSRSTKGAVIECEKEALLVMSEALHEVGDAFAIFGFSGDNRDNVDFYIMKAFDETYGDSVRRRIASISDRYENRDGAAIRHAVNILRKRRERAKLLILISDGKPVDKNYQGEYAVEDTRAALKEAHRDGIRSFCITVDREAADYLPRMYSSSRWIVIDEVARLPERITGIYRMLTA